MCKNCKLRLKPTLVANTIPKKWVCAVPQWREWPDSDWGSPEILQLVLDIFSSPMSFDFEVHHKKIFVDDTSLAL